MLSEVSAANLRVLVADDDERSRSATVSLLETFPGLRVIAVADNGEEAVRLAAEHLPDAVLMDAIMPRLDGIGAARRINQLNLGCRIVLFTLYGGLETDARNAGVSAFLVKSAEGEEIVEALRGDHHPTLVHS